MDIKQTIGGAIIVGPQTFVRFCIRFAISKEFVFKNEDTGWGWPPYFKFNSADVTAEAQAFATDKEKPWVLVKYYGWRFTMFSMFPNVLDLKKVGKTYTHVPVFNIVVAVVSP